MLYHCECGTDLHLNRKENSPPINNMMCLSCFKEKKPNMYIVQYEIFPLRAIYTEKVFAQSEDQVFDILQKSKDVQITIRLITEV